MGGGWPEGRHADSEGYYVGRKAVMLNRRAVILNRKAAMLSRKMLCIFRLTAVAVCPSGRTPSVSKLTSGVLPGGRMARS